MAIRFFFILWAIFDAPSVYAHEVRPAALEITQSVDNRIDVVWKLPITNGRKLKLFPQLPLNCKLPNDSKQEVVDTIIVESWQSQCTLDKGEISISGLERTLTDVFVRIKRPGQKELIRILRPSEPILNLSQTDGAVLSAYIGIGFEHILQGWDHLLFVLALLLIVARRQIFWVITAFTLGHSITLGISALSIIEIPSGPVELLIALSIFSLGVEAMRKLNGKNSMVINHPWIISTAFGLLHGLGFAGALAEIGLPTGQELLALALFNMGIELGQILFIIFCGVIYWMVQKVEIVSQYNIEIFLTYMVGTMGAYYTMLRIF